MARAPKVLGSTSSTPQPVPGLERPVPPLSAVLKDKEPFEWSAWFGVMAPAKATGQLKSEAWSAVTKAANASGFRDKFEKSGFEVGPLNRGEFKAFVGSKHRQLKPFVLEATFDEAK